ncbi:hypothetical protein, partial [Streptomyces sp. DH12]|uniref:hypothetical protein n=1 Tax=Streptomyces sp. DH12 TaxID=2857010 RepID=UPI001E4BC3D7
MQSDFVHGNAEVCGGVLSADPEAVVVYASGNFVHWDAQEEGRFAGVAAGGPANELDGRATADEALIEGDAGWPDETFVPVLLQEGRDVV